VRVTLKDGTVLEAETGGHAQQWGQFAVLTLKGRSGAWTISALAVNSSSRTLG
jgi:hypothetical protein